MADSLRLRADKVYAIRRGPKQAARPGAVTLRRDHERRNHEAEVMSAEVMAAILAGPAEMW
jgi:hypothetical protein